MIAVDSSVWIDFFNGNATPASEELKRLLQHGAIELVMPDLVLFEVLRGFRLEREFRQAGLLLRALSQQAVCDPSLVERAAVNWRAMRAAGFTIKSPVDTLVGTSCIENDHFLLHSDADFDAMEHLLGLKMLHPSNIAGDSSR